MLRGHLPKTEQISVSRHRGDQSHDNRERRCLAVGSVSGAPVADPGNALPGRALQERNPALSQTGVCRVFRVL